MKKLRITFFCCCIIVCAGLFLGCNLPKNEYLRIHIRANSNAQCDQDIKYQIRDEIVAALTPIVASCDSKQQAVEHMKMQTEYISRIASNYLQSKGFAYGEDKNF